MEIARIALYGQTHCRHCVVDTLSGRSRPCMSHSAFSSRRVVCQTCEIWVDNNNRKMVPILANLCCLEANLVSNCGKKNSKCLYSLLGHKIITFLFNRQKNRCPSYYFGALYLIGSAAVTWNVLSEYVLASIGEVSELQIER